MVQPYSQNYIQANMTLCIQSFEYPQSFALNAEASLVAGSVQCILESSPSPHLVPRLLVRLRVVHQGEEAVGGREDPVTGDESASAAPAWKTVAMSAVIETVYVRILYFCYH